MIIVQTQGLCNLLTKFLMKTSLINYMKVFFVGGYRCTLKEEWLKKARDELNEEEIERLPAIQALREWILQQKWLKTPTGIVDSFKLIGA